MTRKALAAFYTLDATRDLAYLATRRGGVRFGSEMLPLAWVPGADFSGWWRRGKEGQFANFAIPIGKDIVKDAVRALKRR